MHDPRCVWLPLRLYFSTVVVLFLAKVDVGEANIILCLSSNAILRVCVKCLTLFCQSREKKQPLFLSSAAEN